MNKTERRKGGRFRRLITAVFALVFVGSLFSTISAFAASSLFKIKNVELSKLSSTAEGVVSSFDESTIVSNVTFHKINDIAEYTITLRNTDSKDHVIKAITDDNKNSHIVYEYDQHGGEQINAGSDLVFVVTAKYVATVESNQREQAVNVKFYINFTDIEEEVPIVPDTGINSGTSEYIQFSVTSMVISAAMLTIIGIVVLKKNKKISKAVVAGIIAVTAISTTATIKAATVDVNSISVATNYSLYDKYVVTYEDANGTKHDEVVGYNEVANISDQIKEGYAFTGWVDENGEAVDLSEPIMGDITIRPTFRANEYSIRFNGNGATSGEIADLPMVFDEAKALSANAFVNTGSTFMGWDTQANGAGVHYDDQAEVKNLTAEDGAIFNLYAQWSINPYFIEYDGNGATGGEMAKTNCEYNQNCTLRTNAFAKRGYDFDGWKLNGQSFADGQEVRNLAEQGTVTLVAQWKAHVYRVTYSGLTTEEEEYLREQGNPDSYTIESQDTTLKKPADRKDADGDITQHCIGWRDVTVYDDITLPIIDSLGDKQYEAVWEAVALPEYNISYDYDGGAVAAANPTKHNKKQSFTLNEPAKIGYTFTGWTGTTIQGDTPVKPYTLPNPHARSDIEFVAHFRKNNYTIEFDGNGATSGATASMNMKYDESENLTTSGFTRTGYIFSGWNTQADGSGTNYTDGQEVRNLTDIDGLTVTLHAKWSPIHYNIAFHQNADNVSGSMTTMSNIAYDETVNLTENAFALSGYKFMGWNTMANGTGTSYADKASVKNLTTTDGATIDLNAQWKESTATFGTFGNPSTTSVSKFAHYTAGTPSAETLANATNIATRDSNFPIYGWEDGEYYYWWSEAESARIPSNSSRFFERNGKYVEITFDGIDTSHVTNASAILHNNTRLKKVDLSNFDTSSLVNAQSMFEACYALETVILPEGFGQNVTDASRMFYGASKLKTINMVDFDSTNLENTTSMFYGATALTSLTLPENFGKKITDAANMFNGTSIATMNIDDFVPEQPTSIYGMFAGTKMTSINLSHWNFSSVTSLANLFNNCTNLTSVDLGNWSTENITNMSGMFKNTAIPDFSFLESWNVSSVENMSSMFEGTKDTQMDLSSWNVSKVKNMTNMFLSSSLTSLNISTWDTPLLENMYQMLRYTRLTTLDISKLDTRNVTNMVWALTQMNNLKTVYVGENWNTDGITGGNGASMFDGAFKIVGGAGTVHINEQQYTNQSRARIDDPDNGKPGYFSIKGARYIRYDGNGADNSEYETMTSHYITNETPLKENAFVRDGYAFNGWNTQADGNGTSYTNKQVISDLVESKTPLTLYATWREKRDFEGTIDLTRQYSSANVLQLSGSMSGEYVGAAYFNPADLSETCTATSENVADKEAKTGCMKWFIYDDSGSNYKMILDHNTTKLVTFNSSNKNSNPQALYDRLEADTADWDSTKLSTNILTAADVAAISNINSFNPANSTYYSLGTEINSSDGKGRSAFGWLYDYTRECETHGCDHEVSTGYGHWTTTPVSGNTKNVWLINYFGRLTFTEAKLGNWGIRPIVTVAKSLVNAQ